MAEAPVVDLNQLVDDQAIQRSTIVYLIVATLVLVGDGFDLSAIGYVGPELVKLWHITSRDLVPMFSAGIFGLLVGAPLLGFVATRSAASGPSSLALCCSPPCRW